MTKILKFPEVVLLTRLSRSTIIRLIRHGRFPEALKLSERSIGWLEADVLEWLKLVKEKASKSASCEAMEVR